MPLHDYYCAACGQIAVDIYRSAAQGASAAPPLHCDRPMVWIPQTRAMDVGGVKTAAFQAFHTTDGRGRPVLVDNLRTLRRIERESEQMFRNGEGQPMVWRRWAQDPSNRDQPTLSRSYDGSEQPSSEAKHRFGSTRAAYAGTPDGPPAALDDTSRPFGPGVSLANASALPEEP